MPAVRLDLTDDSRLEAGALYRKEITSYLPPPAGQEAAYLSLRVDGVWTVTRTVDGQASVEELAASPGGGFQSGDVVYVRQDGVDGPWLVVAAADVEDLSEYSEVQMEIRKDKSYKSQLVLGLNSNPGGGLVFNPTTAPHVLIETVVPEDVFIGNWYYDVKLMSATPRRLCEGRALIVPEVTDDDE